MEIQRIKISEQERQLVSAFMGEEYPSEIDFNWLMEVYKKIAYVWSGLSSKEQGQVKQIKGALQNRLILGEIQGVWEFSVDFIKWYNSNTKP